MMVTVESVIHLSKTRARCVFITQLNNGGLEKHSPQCYKKVIYNSKDSFVVLFTIQQ